MKVPSHEISCLACGNKKLVWPYQLNKAKYCSIRCGNLHRWKSPTVKMLTHVEKAQKAMSLSRIGIRHSEETKQRISESRIGKAVGSANPRWRGGITKLRIAIHGLPEYRRWRTKIFQKDDFSCQMCGKRGVYIEADHFPIPFRELIGNVKTAQQARFSVQLWNASGRTLCRPCHDTTKVFVSNQYV